MQNERLYPLSSGCTEAVEYFSSCHTYEKQRINIA